MPKQKRSKIDELTFQPIEDSVVILSRNGAYSQHKAYVRRGEVFAKVGSFYVGLRRHNTSVSRYHLVEFDLGTDIKFSYTDLGRVVIKDGSK